MAAAVGVVDVSPFTLQFLWVHFLTYFSFIIDDDRYSHSERDKGDRHGRRDRDSRDNRNGRQQPPPPPQAPQDDRRAPREGFQNIPTGPRAERSKAPNGATPSGPQNPSSTMPPPPVPASHNTLPEPSSPYVPPMTDNDLSAIRSRYLGVDKKKRKIRKMNDRKFVFDWDAQDDTFAEDSPVAVGSNRQGAQVMFGRGRLAGMDDGGGSGPRKNSSGAAHLADPMERRKAAKAGLDERHWTDKPLEEMKERDWRIFREDFSISARGWFHGPFSSLHTNSFSQVARYLILSGHGPNLASPKLYWLVLIPLVTRSRPRFSDRRFLSGYRTVTL